MNSPSSLSWSEPDLFPVAPPEGSIHLWRHSLTDRPVRALWLLLSPAERQRAERYRFDDDRNGFVLRRGTLRLLLGRYLHTPPERIVFTYGTHGKPALDSSHDSCLRFNLSCTDDLALYAFASGSSLGVDVECVQPPIEDPDRLAEHVFSSVEREAFSRLPPAERLRGFLNGWTRKEAFIKALGKGLSLPLDAFDVTLTPGRPAALLAVRATCDADWFLQALRPTPGHVAALAVRGTQRQVHRFAWSTV